MSLSPAAILYDSGGTEKGTAGNPVRTDTTGTTTQPVSGTVTANIGTAGTLALDATLTGGTTKAVARGGAKGATTAADVTSTAEGVDHQAIDVQIYHGGTSKDPTQVRALTNADVISSEVTRWIGSTAPTVGQKTMANSVPMVISSDQTVIPVSDNAGSLTVDSTQLPSALVGSRLDVNTGAWLGSTAPTVGQKTMANSVPIVVSSDQTTLPVKELTAATSSVTSVASSATSVTLLASNANRLGATLWNDSNQNLFLKLGATASNTSFTVRISTNSYYEIPFNYTGIIDGIWNSANGNARITELSA